jgi:hypothetical protein
MHTLEWRVWCVLVLVFTFVCGCVTLFSSQYNDTQLSCVFEKKKFLVYLAEVLLRQ